MLHTDDSTLEVRPPLLRIVELDHVLPHEEHDLQRSQPLMRRIEASGIWLHPPLVAPLPDIENKYVVLDGANRCHSLKHLGYPHILVQVVDYESGQVKLDTWNHVISELPFASMLPLIKALPNVEVQESDILTARATLARREALAYVVEIASRTAYILTTPDLSLKARNRHLIDLVDCYRQAGKLDRLNSHDPGLVRQMFPTSTALIVFPHYEPAEIMVAARDQILLPPGISRHIIQGRAMRLNYPLEALRDPHLSIVEKNTALEKWMIGKISQRAVRFYAESTYLFDE
ncbi:MAG: hypothetical protein BroJett018_36850 [Chloroflexota bacterium]|nr:MAG: hypothetical protein BroJett018_36850 [Chloroflexota bacterium]